MKRRIAVLLSLIVWVMIGKAMAQAQNHSDLAVNKCVEDVLARNIEKPHDLTVNRNFSFGSCVGPTANCFVANFQAVGVDGSFYKGQVTVIADKAGNCHLGQAPLILNREGGDVSQAE